MHVTQDIPLIDPKGKRSLSILIGFMFFLVTFFTIISFNLFQSRQHTKDFNSFFIHIAPIFEPQNFNTDAHAIDQEKPIIATDLTIIYKKIVSLLKGTKNIHHITKMSIEDIAENLQYWQYNKNVFNLFDGITLFIQAEKNEPFEIEAFITKIKSIHPHTYFHFIPKQMSEKNTLPAFYIHFYIFFLPFSLLICFIIFLQIIMRYSTQMNAEIMSTLKLMGAKSSYVYNAYKKQIFTNTIMSITISSICCLMILYGINIIFSLLKAPPFLENVLSIQNIQIIFITAIIFIVLSMSITKKIVSRMINK